MTALCSPVHAALQACTSAMSPRKWFLMQQRIQWNPCGGSSRSLHWNCSISSFLLQAVPSSHKSLISTSCWSGIDMKDVKPCHKPMCKAHGDMRCLYITALTASMTASSYNGLVNPSQESKWDCMTRGCVRMTRTGLRA